MRWPPTADPRHCSIGRFHALFVLARARNCLSSNSSTILSINTLGSAENGFGESLLFPSFAFFLNVMFLCMESDLLIGMNVHAVTHARCLEPHSSSGDGVVRQNGAHLLGSDKVPD